jgi:transposase
MAATLASPVVQWVGTQRRKLQVELVKRADDTGGFKVFHRRWVVGLIPREWLMRHRHLVRDYETTEAGVEAWVYIAMRRLQLRRLA